MNINRTKLREFLSSHSDYDLFLGNKIVKCRKNQRAYFDISIGKEIFGKKKDEDVLFSLTDVSNFQTLHMPSIYVGDGITPLANDSIVAPYTNLCLFMPMIEQKYYVTHLQPLWQYGRLDLNADEIMYFLNKYNKENISRINQKVDSDRLQVSDWWYCGGEYMKPEDFVDVLSTYEENLSKALGVVYDGGYPASKCMKKSFGKK